MSAWRERMQWPFFPFGLFGWLIVWLGAGVAVSPSAFAFPENVRHRYVNCSSCHVNPNGGGQLNAYGRQLSKALQSNGKFFFEFGEFGKRTGEDAAGAAAGAASGMGMEDETDKEAEFLYGALPKPDWLQLGGDLRFVQSYIDTPAFSETRFIAMQADLEAAATFGRFTVDATIGRDDPAAKNVKDPGFSDYLVSRRHYLLFQATDEIFVMGGRYWKPHGINDSRHISLTKRGLGWDFGTESYNIQVGYLGGRYNLTAYGDFGRPGDGGTAIEKGGGATGAVGIADAYKVGFSYFYGVTDFARRHVAGPWAILGFTERLYLRTEHDFVRSSSKFGGDATVGYVGETRLGYEFVQGVHAYAETQWGQLNLELDASRQQFYGLGLLYYPRPHWEFEANYQQRKSGTVGQPFIDYAYLLLHYYL